MPGRERGQVADGRYRGFEEAVDGVAVHGLVLEEHRDEPVEDVAVPGDEVGGPLLGLARQPGHLGVDGGLGLLGERPAGQGRAPTAEEDRSALR